MKAQERRVTESEVGNVYSDNIQEEGAGQVLLTT